MNARSRCKTHNRYAALGEDNDNNVLNNGCRNHALIETPGGINGIDGDTINNIVNVNRDPKQPQSVPPKGSPFRPTDVEEVCVVDSGACTAVLKPQSFPNTKLVQTALSGQSYKACVGVMRCVIWAKSELRC